MYEWFDRFCHKHERKGVKHLMSVIAVGGLAVFLMDYTMAGSGVTASGLLLFHRDAVLAGEYWRLITFIFVPSGGGLLTLLVLYFYHWMGRLLEAEWGRLKLSVFYLTGIILMLIYGFITGAPATGTELNLSLFLAVATIMPDMQIRIMFILPVKMKWLAFIRAGSILLVVILGSTLMPLIPLGNYLLYFYPELKRLIRRSKRKEPLDFRRERRRIEEEKKQREFLRQCAVCGLTDTEDPKMDFRYCSLCSGRKCYCRKHLFDHEHS